MRIPMLRSEPGNERKPLIVSEPANVSDPMWLSEPIKARNPERMSGRYGIMILDKRRGLATARQ